MNEHTGFHNKEHYSPDCPRCEQDMLPTEEVIIAKCQLSPKTVKLLKDMSEETYKEIAREIIFLAKPIILAEVKQHYEQKKSMEFARRIARTMDDLKSSHAFFIIQQAYSDMDWNEAQSILDEVIKETENE